MSVQLNTEIKIFLNGRKSSKIVFVKINAARSPKVKVFCYFLLDSNIFELEI